MNLRNFAPDDFDALLRLLAEIEAADHSGDPVDAPTLRRQLSWRNHDPGRDRWLGFSAAGELRGHAWLLRQSAQRAVIHVAVHPQQRRRGWGSALLAAALRRAGELGLSQAVAGAAAHDAPGDAFLRRRGFTPAGHTRLLSAPANTPLAAPEFPPGFSLRSMADLGDDFDLLAQAYNACYTDMWGHRENTEACVPEHFHEYIGRNPNFYFRDGVFILFAPAGEIAGLMVCRLGDGDPQQPARRDKVLDAPAAPPAYRALDVQRPLVMAGMRWLAAQADGPYRLETWGDSERAVALYRQIGFTLEPQNDWAEYVKLL